MVIQCLNVCYKLGYFLSGGLPFQHPAATLSNLNELEEITFVARFRNFMDARDFLPFQKRKEVGQAFNIHIQLKRSKLTVAML